MSRDPVEAPAEPRMPRFTGWLRPVVDAVARVKAGVHRKLLFGFLAGALLLVAMAVLSLVVISQMNDRMEELNRAQVKAGRAQEMLYAITAQSHYRAMALLIPADAAKYNGQVEDAKAGFAKLLDDMERAEPANAAFYEGVRQRQRGVPPVRSEGAGAVRPRPDPAGRGRSTSTRSTRPRTSSRRRCGRSSPARRTTWPRRRATSGLPHASSPAW